MIRLALLFVLVGPVIGCLSYWGLAMCLSELSPDQIDALKNLPLSEKLFANVVTLAFFAVAGYPFALYLGAIPAAVSAVSYWLTLRYNTRKNPPVLGRMLLGGLFGGLAATACGLMSKYQGLNETHATLWSVTTFWTMPGAMASAACASLVTHSWYSVMFPARAPRLTKEQ